MTPSYILHIAIVFLSAFLLQVGAGLTNATSMPALVALATSAATAGLSAVVHAIFNARANKVALKGK